jgi:hypothetical protein
MLSAAKHLFVSSSIAGKCNERGNLNIRRNFSGFSPAMFYAVPNTRSGLSTNQPPPFPRVRDFISDEFCSLIF